MNAKQAIDKIAELLKFTFKSEKFYSTKLQDGTEVTNNLDEDFKIGQVLYVVGESTLTPAPMGSHITRENLKVTVDSESVIIAIESGDDIAEDAVETTDTESELLESNTSDMGEMSVMDGMEADESTSRIEEIINLLLPMVEEMKKMQSEMEKMKQQMSADISTLTNDFNSFKKSPEKFSVVEKKTMKESFDDYKLDLIKSLRK
jgi:hypothetical protein